LPNAICLPQRAAALSSVAVRLYRIDDGLTAPIARSKVYISAHIAAYIPAYFAAAIC